ncbi:hypothetical protein ACT21L_000098 [Vibrio vulnificus]|nr:hypothetical protein [Vibrio vulnificus]ELI3521913.1 hypothetical protein [Vibrio vulnificus]
MNSDLKVTFHTVVNLGQENQLYVWLIRMKHLIERDALKKNVVLSVLLHPDIQLENFPQLPCIIRFLKAPQFSEPDLLKLAALNEALAPSCKTAVFMSLNVLPTQSLKLFLEFGENNSNHLTGLMPSQNRKLWQDSDEHFRRMAITKNYYTSDLLVFDVDTASRKLATTRTFDLVERRQLITNSGANIVDDILNKLLPSRCGFKEADVFYLDPVYLNDNAALLDSPRSKVNVAAVYSQEALPWNDTTASPIEKLTPYDLYATATCQASEWLSPDFVASVLKKANYWLQQDKLRSAYLPSELTELLCLEATESQIYHLVCQLRKEGCFQ